MPGPGESPGGLRRYHGFMADSARWRRFQLRPDDVVISTPGKSGTTWMQTIVGMLILGRIDLGAPISEISPWLDMLIHPEDSLFATLEQQTHRRFIKTHTPMDGLPYHESVTYVVVARHPMDVALSRLDHRTNMRQEHAAGLRMAASGAVSEDVPVMGELPKDIGDYLRWFVDNDEPATGTGPNGLADFCDQLGTYWPLRGQPNVHLFHYTDLWNDLDGQMRQVAEVLGVRVDEQVWSQMVDAATLTSMRSRAATTAPEAHLDLWSSPDHFFRAGGTRDWQSRLTADDIDHFHQRLDDLAGDAARWARYGTGAAHR
jgi:aryl sulfotransferase